MSSDSNTYSKRYMKEKRIKHFKARLVVIEMPGKSTAITLREKARDILGKLYASHQTDDVEVEKIRVIKTAADLIKSDFVAYSAAPLDYPNFGNV